MNDIQFNFLVKVAQTQPEARQELITNPEYQPIVKKLGRIGRDVLGSLLGSQHPGNVAKAWLSLVTQAASERSSRTMSASEN